MDTPRSPERRADTRLADGMERRCPDCGGRIEFQESYRVFRTERRAAEPAWVCQTRRCGYREFIRR